MRASHQREDNQAGRKRLETGHNKKPESQKGETNLVHIVRQHQPTNKRATQMV